MESNDMQVTARKEEELLREYTVTLEAASIRSAMEARLKQVGARVKIAGFRPGHVPVSVLEQKYGKSVMGEVLEETIQRATGDVIRQHALRPATQPKVKIEKYADGEDLEFSVVVELFPKVPEIAYDKIALKRPTFSVETKHVDEAIARFAARNKTLNALSSGTKAKKGHVVEIDFKGMLKGVPFEGGEAKHFKLELGSGQFIPGFEDQLAGVKEGDETTVTVTFPEDYHKSELAGEEAQFEIKVHAVLEAALPELNDDFAKTAGFETLEQFQAAVRSQLEAEYAGVVREKLKRQLFDVLEKEYVFAVPSGLLESEFNAIWERLMDARKAGEASLDKPEDELREEYRKIAERRVRLGILLAEVGTRHQIAATNEELTKAVMQQARMFPGQEKKVFEFYRSHPARMDDLRGPILEDKSVDFILTQVTLTDRPITIEELVKPEEEEEESSGGKKKAKKKA